MRPPASARHAGTPPSAQPLPTGIAVVVRAALPALEAGTWAAVEARRGPPTGVAVGLSRADATAQAAPPARLGSAERAATQLPKRAGPHPFVVPATIKLVAKPAADTSRSLFAAAAVPAGPAPAAQPFAPVASRNRPLLVGRPPVPSALAPAKGTAAGASAGPQVGQSGVARQTKRQVFRALRLEAPARTRTAFRLVKTATRQVPTIRRRPTRPRGPAA